MLRLLLLLATLCSWSAFVRGQDTEAARVAEVRAVETARDVTLRAALTFPTQMNFPDVTMQDAVDFLSEYHKIKILFDKKALADAGIDMASPIDMRVVDIPLSSGLNMMLGENDLTWIIENDVITITTVDAAQERKSSRIYSVADLVAPAMPGMHDADRGSIEDLASAVALVLYEEPGMDHAPPAAAPADGEAAAAPPAEEVRAQAGHDVIVRLPAHLTGSAPHPRIRPFRGNLVVKASFHEHERIRELLDELRANRASFPAAGVPGAHFAPPVSGPPADITADPVPDTTALPLPIPSAPKGPIKIKPVPED